MDNERFFSGNFFLGANHDPKFEVRTIPVPKLKGHEVLIKVMACGICGTDVHIYHGEKGSAEVTPPVVLGHEFSGIVEATGPDVTLVKPGDHVTMDPNMYCGTCRPCRMGKKQNCEHLFALGVNTNGGFAEYCISPEAQCFQLDKSIPFDIAALTEPLACAVHGIDRLAIREGETVLVIGGGTIGMIMIQLARSAGAGTVILSEPVAFKRELGLELGADFALDPASREIPDFLLEKTGISYADCVIECVGKTAAVAQAFSAAGRGTKILLFSVPGVDSCYSLPLFDVYSRELTIMGSMINPDTHLRAVNLINNRKIELGRLVTHCYGLKDLEKAILTQMSNESMKVVIHPQE